MNGVGQGFPGFLKIANDYGSTKAGNLAQLYAGLSYAKLGKYQEAVTRLEDFKNCGDAMVSPAAIGALGNCYAELDQLDKATSTLLEAAKKADKKRQGFGMLQRDQNQVCELYAVCRNRQIYRTRKRIKS